MALAPALAAAAAPGARLALTGLRGGLEFEGLGFMALELVSSTCFYCTAQYHHFQASTRWHAQCFRS